MVSPRRRAERGLLPGLALLLIGIGIGAVLDLQDWLRPRGTGSAAAPEASREPVGPFRTDAGQPLADNGLETLHLSFEAPARRRLQETRSRAMLVGSILQTDEDTVAGRVRHGEREYTASVRIKGDQLDHIATDKWSLRIELDDGALFGMSRFSIQAPHTRAGLWGWMALAAARHEGLLAPRARFVNVVVDGRPNGIYQLEEHFSKELLESQGRREGPIVRFTEDAWWDLGRTTSSPFLTGDPSALILGPPVVTAEIEAFGEKRLAQREALNRQLRSAHEALREVQLGIAAQPPGRQLDRTIVDRRGAEASPDAHNYDPHEAAGFFSAMAARLQAASELEGRAVGQLLDLGAFARMTALLSLFSSEHGIAWHNVRFYHDPVRERLEPVVYDVVVGTGAHGAVEPLLWSPKELMRFLNRSPDFTLQALDDLVRVTDPIWLEEFVSTLEPQVATFEAALAAEGLVPARGDAASLVDSLRQAQLQLRRRLRPEECVNFLCHIETERADEGTPTSGTVVVEAWGTSRVPVIVEGFRLENGRFIDAAGARTRGVADGAVEREGAVLLPWDGRRVRFAFPVDERLATLREIREITDAVRLAEERDRTVRLSVRAEYRPTTSAAVRDEPLRVRRFHQDWEAGGGRPQAPSLAEALERHPFLHYDASIDRLSVVPGDWKVAGDLVVPEGSMLHAGPGTRLAFEEQAVLVSTDGLVFRGTAEAPVVLGPAAEGGSWAGLLVLDARRTSVWTHVEVRATREIQRGGWITTGGVTFYESPVEVRACAFLDARGEDALNIFGTEFLIDESRITGCSSDAFDGDFVQGLVRASRFERVAADAVDTSGSRVEVVDCVFTEVGDKAVSAGEQSTITVRGGRVESASIGIASKDGSRVEATGLAIEQARFYGMAAYVKKPEFPSAVIVSTGTTFGAMGEGETLAQTGCEVRLDGQLQPVRDVDVDALYAEKVLGQ